MAKKTKDENPQEEADVKSAPQINDVAKPGSAPAPATSRPVITGHGSMIKKDPMVAGGDDKKEENDSAEDKKPLKKKTEIKLTPLDEANSEESAEETDEKVVEKEEAQEPEETDVVEPAAEEPKPDVEKKDEETPENPSTSEAAAIESLAGSAQSKNPTTKEVEAEKVREAKVKELIETKKYNVQITEGGHKATSQRIVSWILLLLLLCAVGVYLAADAGYIDIGVDLPYDLIKN